MPLQEQVGPASARLAHLRLQPVLLAYLGHQFDLGLEAEADACLEWYRPKLRDPRRAYYRNPTMEGRVLTITLHATNAFGGYLSKSAACEMKGGEVDDGWTKIHAERLGWVERCMQVVVPLGSGVPQVGVWHRGRQMAGESITRGCEP